MTHYHTRARARTLSLTHTLFVCGLHAHGDALGLLPADESKASRSLSLYSGLGLAQTHMALNFEFVWSSNTTTCYKEKQFES